MVEWEAERGQHDIKEVLADTKLSGTSPVPQTQQMQSQRDRLAVAYDEPQSFTGRSDTIILWTGG